MTSSKIMRIACITTLLLALTGIMAAQGPSSGTTTTSELSMGANVQTAVQLNVATGSGGATVSGNNSTGLFQIDFGNVNALGTGTPATGVTVVADANGSLYKTPISVTPVFTGFTTETAYIGVTQSAGGDVAMTRESDSGISAASTVNTVGFNPVASGVTSGTPIERWVGMYVSRSEPAGTKSSTIIYTVTMDF
jgi:hypothetical protein